MPSRIMSYVRRGERWWRVSTIDREASSPYAYGMRYAETMAWEWDADTKRPGRIVGQDEGPEGSIEAHLTMCRRLLDTGHAMPQEDDDA